jgi:signal transduction histidine kinase
VLRRLFVRSLVLALASLAPGASAPVVAAQQSVRRTRVLVLYQQQAETQPMREFTKALRLAISSKSSTQVDYYEEALDFDRVAGREHSPALTSYFDDKYRRLGVDVVVPVGSRALRFAIEHLRPVLPSVPIVFALCAAPQTDTASLPPYVTGRIASESRFSPTLSMARRLQPEANAVVVIGGAGAADSVSVAAAVRAVSALHDSLRLTVLQGLSLDSLLPRLRQLSPHAIAIFANYRRDARERAFEPLDIIGSIARASRAPMYTQLMSYVGEGVIGGSVIRFDDEGARTGLLVARVLGRKPGIPMPPVEVMKESFAADSRQLRRFDLPESRLPPATLLLYREPTVWERHRGAVLLTISVIAVELLLIGGLLVERRRRKRAQRESEEHQRRVEESRQVIAHMGRIALLGELTTTIAHELRQPLTAIRVNADSGVTALQRAGRELGEEDREILSEIFGAIADDNALASDIITRVRSLGRRQESPQQDVDLNEVCRASVRLLQHAALTRGAELHLSLDARLPLVSGDPVQFQQVVLNLILNALEACADTSAPRVEICSVVHDTEVEVVVRDNGPGLTENVRPHLFDSFFSTKSEGLGLGLAIVRSIIDRHHGRIDAGNDEHGGAVFRIVLPRSRSVQHHLDGSGLTNPSRVSSP